MIFTYSVGRKAHIVELRSLAEIPVQILRASTKSTLMWDSIAWAIQSEAQLAILDVLSLRVVRKLYRDWIQDSCINAQDIVKVDNFVKANRDALAADLLECGLRLRNCPSDEFNWYDLHVFVTQASTRQSRIRAILDEDYPWDLHAMILAGIHDHLSWLQWAETKGAAEGTTDPPWPMVRPGVAPQEFRAGSRTKAMPISKLNQLAGRDPDKTSDDRQKRLQAALRG